MNINQDKSTKIGIILLVLLLSFMIVKFLKTSNEYKTEIQKSELEINILESQLNEILDRYDSIHFESKVSKDLLFLNADIRSLNDNSTHFIDSNVPVIKTKNKDEITLVVNRPKKKNGLKAANINVKGVKIFSDIYKNDNTKIQQLRVCFTLSSDSFIKEGAKKIYIQAINPNGEIITADTISFGDGSETTLAYSAISEVFFNNLDVDGCVYVDLDDKNTIKGEYIVNLYCDFALIGSTTFYYR